jgi:hypothetical protein
MEWHYKKYDCQQSTFYMFYFKILIIQLDLLMWSEAYDLLQDS